MTRRTSNPPPRLGAGRSVTTLYSIDETAELFATSSRTMRRLIASERKALMLLQNVGSNLPTEPWLPRHTVRRPRRTSTAAPALHRAASDQPFAPLALRSTAAWRADPSSDVKDLHAQPSLKADIGRKGHLPAVTNTASLIPIFGTPKSRPFRLYVGTIPIPSAEDAPTPPTSFRFRKIVAPAVRLLLPLAPRSCAIDRMQVIARRGLRAILIGHSNEISATSSAPAHGLLGASSWPRCSVCR